VVDAVVTPLPAAGGAMIGAVVETGSTSVDAHQRDAPVERADSRLEGRLDDLGEATRAPERIGRIHKTLRVTPAMEAGKADHVWSLEEIAGLAS
jgi:hypothetical protein